MSHTHASPWSRRIAAGALAFLQTVLPGAAQAASLAEPEPLAAPPAPAVAANRTVPKVDPPRLTPRFSAAPTTAEISEARVFGEPLLPVGGNPDPAENKALAEALLGFLASKGTKLDLLESFLDLYPSSPWRASLLTNMGGAYRRRGFFTRAMGAWEEAWHLSKGAADTTGRVVAERAIGDLLEWNAQFGRADALEVLLGEIQGREIEGPPAQKIGWAKESLWLLRNRHQDAIPSGPLALDRVMRHGAPQRAPHAQLLAAHATHEGISLAEMRDLSRKVGLNLKMVFRKGDVPIPVPSVVHLRAGHFSAVVREENGLYLLDDPILGGDMWVSREALNAETSGYFLVPAGALIAGAWRTVSDIEGRRPRGKCAACAPPLEHQRPCDEKDGGDCPEGGCAAGMAFYSFHTLLASLTISDEPVGYSSSRGPAPRFTLTYLQREAFQASSPTYSNLGPQWVHTWLSWIEDNPAALGNPAYVVLRGGGRETYSSYDSATQSFAPHVDSQAGVVRTSTSPIIYERRLPDGSVEVYAQSDGGVSPRRVFLTQLKDAQGNSLTFTYDASFRLVAATDAIGQVTTLSYEHATDTRKITKVTDPFGRSASFTYDSSGRLTKITDVMGMASEFKYGTGIIASMTTPYGTTSFAWGAGGFVWERWLEATDPLLAKERVQTIWDSALPVSEPATSVPTGFEAHNVALDQGVTLYWDKRAMALAPGDITKATQTHWMFTSSGAQMHGSPHTEKKPLEGRVWYAYPGQSMPSRVGSIAKPSQVARVLDDGTTQATRFEYNSRGLTTKEIDPLGRETLYVYGTNNVPDPDPATGAGLDLLQVKQKNGASYDLLASTTYDAQHRPLTTTDAAGQTTTVTYNAQGQPSTITTPPRAGITENRTTTYSYDTNGMLQSITGPAAGATTSFTYDGYGRLRTETNPDSYTRTYDYDALDRLTKTTFPDGSYEETVYNRLDAEKQRDRLGRWTHIFHDALRRQVAIRDPLGRTTTLQWGSASSGSCGGSDCGGADKLIDANGNATTWERDLQGRLTREVRPDGAGWETTYENTTSRVKQRKDPKNQITGYEYFLDNNLKQVTYTNAQVATPNVSFTYDPAFNRRTSITDGTGMTNYIYHAVAAPPTLGAGQLASTDGPLTDDTISYSYDELGRVLSRGPPTFTTTYAYDALGRLTTIGSPVGSFGYGYDGISSRLSSTTYPNGQTTSNTYFDNTGDRQLKQIKHLAPAGATLTQFDYTYDVVGNIKSWRQQFGTNPAKLYELGYDPAGQLIAATLKSTDPTPVVLKRYGYGYDPTGNRTSDQVDDAVMAGGHNTNNQLVTRQPGGALIFKGTVNESATVTVAGKPAEVKPDNTFQGQAPVPSGTSTVQVQAQDSSGNVRTNTYQISQTGSATSYSYDANGNLISDAARTFEWDAANRLVRVTQGTTELARFVYDGQGRRVQKIAGGVTWTYVYDGEDIVEARLSAGPIYRYVRGLGIDEPLARTDGGSVAAFYLSDHLGSVVQETSAAGSVSLTREYDPYGNLLQGASTSGYAFTGREWDVETALYYYRARHYLPTLGRFLSEDPIGFDGGINFYTYVENNPVNQTDPYGLAPPSGPKGPKSPFEPPGYIHASIPQITTGQSGPKPGEIQTAAVLLLETKTLCEYLVVSGARFAGGLVGIAKSRIASTCGKSCPVSCPKPGFAIQFFMTKPRIDQIKVGRVNINCNAIP